jgi:hypothetical protein
VCSSDLFAAQPYETLILDNLNKTLDDYQARYDDEDTKPDDTA